MQVVPAGSVPLERLPAGRVSLEREPLVRAPLGHVPLERVPTKKQKMIQSRFPMIEMVNKNGAVPVLIFLNPRNKFLAVKTRQLAATCPGMKKDVNCRARARGVPRIYARVYAGASRH